LRSSIKLINNIFAVLIIICLTAYGQTESQENTSTENVSAFQSTKSPLTAVLFSAAFPGAGQIYNESYWKAPVVWGVSAWLIYNWVDNNKNYKSNGDLYVQTRDEDYRRLRTFYRDQRDLFSIYLGLTYVLNLVDAYVDASLFDFTVEEDLFIHQPRIGIRFNLR
jgi:hypothetical protein